jgi:hypothetical protein
VSLLENVQSRLDSGEKLQYAFTGQTGINPASLWIPYIDFLVIGNRARILAFTDQRIAVFSAGQLRWRRSTPQKLLYALPRETALPHGSGSWSKLTVGEEGIWVPRKAYRYLDEATGALPN